MKTRTNNATHTPGPWHIQDNTAYPYGQLRVDSARRGAVAICYTVEGGESTAPVECFQNARLISAAPELLEALSDILHEVTHDIAGLPRDELLDVVSAVRELAEVAIAKATGGER